jgi:hypothetical protein
MSGNTDSDILIVSIHFFSTHSLADLLACTLGTAMNTCTHTHISVHGQIQKAGKSKGITLETTKKRPREIENGKRIKLT